MHKRADLCETLISIVSVCGVIVSSWWIICLPNPIFLYTIPSPWVYTVTCLISSFLHPQCFPHHRIKSKLYLSIISPIFKEKFRPWQFFRLLYDNCHKRSIQTAVSIFSLVILSLACSNQDFIPMETTFLKITNNFCLTNLCSFYPTS